MIGLGAVLAAPLAVRAQQTRKAPRVGLLAATPSDPVWMAFKDALRELGYVEGKNIEFKFQVYRVDDAAELQNAATELAASRVDVIVTGGGNPQVRAAKNATTTIPIVMTAPVQVVEFGLVKSLARPETNVTGLMWDVGPQEASKRLELFKQLVPNLSRMPSLWDPGTGAEAYWPEVRAAAKKLGVSVDSLPVRDTSDLERVLAQIARDRPNGVFVWGSPLHYAQRRRICEWALETRLPTLVLAEQYIEAGCLMSYAPSMTNLFREAAGYVDKILKGARPEDLPVSRPSKFALLINLKTAKALGLTIPPSLLLRADQVIE